MTVTRIFRLCVRFAAWVTPQVKEWRRKRNLKSDRGRAVPGGTELGGCRTASGSGIGRAPSFFQKAARSVAEAFAGVLKQGKFGEAEQTLQMALELADQSKDQSMRSCALASLVDIQLDQKKYGEAEQTIRAIEAIEAAQSAARPYSLGAVFAKTGKCAFEQRAVRRSIRRSSTSRRSFRASFWTEP